MACAFRLKQFSLPVTLLEQSNRVGGVIDTVVQQGFLFETGPQSFLATPPVLDLIAAIGLDRGLLFADPGAPRYICLNGRLEPAPMSPPALLKSSLLNAGTKFRVLSELLRRSHPPADDESLADFVRRKFGQQLLDRLVGPFVSGVFAGNPEKLSARSAFPEVYAWEKQYGSVIRGVMKSRPAKGKSRPGLCSFEQGNSTLVLRLREKLGDSVHVDTAAVAAQRGKSNGKSLFEVSVTQRNRNESIAAEAVVLATPTDAAARILTGVSPRFAELLCRVAYAPVALVANGYGRSQVGHSLGGFGFLVPRTEGLHVLGTVWGSSLFPDRAPQDAVAITSFAGGATDSAFAAQPAEQIGAVVEQEISRILNITGPPVARLVMRHPRALPQYNVGHSALLAALRQELALFPGLFLAGNYLEGASVGSCVEQAFRTAEAVRAYVSAHS